jgi:hypothetical protein
MPPFPPSIVNALLREPRTRETNSEARELRERYARSRIRLRRPLELRAQRDVREAGAPTPVRPASDAGLREAA